MTSTGGCYCGDVRYESTGKPLFKAQCHCRECQYISGGGPNYFMVVPEDGFTYTSGAPHPFQRSDIQNAVTREFCSTCGTHLVTRRDGGRVIVKVGTLDDPATSYGGPKMAIFMCDSQPFHTVAQGLAQTDKLP